MSQILSTLLTQPFLHPELWYLDPELIFLNHGSFGACPRELIECQRAEQVALERSPVAYFLRETPNKFKLARARFAELLAADQQGVCLVSNASEGVATALNTIKWKAGDEVVVSRDAYGACLKMLRHLSKQYGVKIRLAQAPFAIEDHRESGAYQRWTKAVIHAFAEQCNADTRLLLIDHITSPTGLIYPVQSLIELAVHQGALSLVDGAHAPGHVDINLGVLQPDFYTGNAHKWLMSPKSCAILYVGDRWRNQINPLIISHGYDAVDGARLHALFDWTGTRDLSSWMVLPQTLDWLSFHGGWSTFASRNHHLVSQARDLICQAMWDPDPLPFLPPIEALGQMASIPVNPRITAQAQAQLFDLNVQSLPQSIHPLQQWLYQQKIEVPVIPSPYEGAPDFLRISAQVYNSLGEYERLAELLSSLKH